MMAFTQRIISKGVRFLVWVTTGLTLSLSFAGEITQGMGSLDLGEVEIDHRPAVLQLPERFESPVLIVGIPSANDSAPGLVQVKKLSLSEFEIWFQEWNYLDGNHLEESVPYLVVEGGHWRGSDGTLLEAGVTTVAGNLEWKSIRYQQQFPAPPKLFLTPQTFNTRLPFLARVRKLTDSGFEVALFTEQAERIALNPETVGYLAIHDPESVGKLELGEGEMVSYVLESIPLGTTWTPIGSDVIRLQEERSRDRELAHLEEQISLLTIEHGLFGQDVTSAGGDTAALRRFSGDIEQWQAARLLNAVRQGNRKWLEELLASGVNLEARNLRRIGALEMSLIHERYDMLDLLIGKGADPNGKSSDGTTLLGLSIRKGNLRMVERLLAAGAAVNSKDRSGKSPLMYAAEKWNPGFVRLLIKAGADANYPTRNGTALTVAVGQGNPEVIADLLAAKASSNVVDGAGRSPLRLALEKKEGDDIVDMLLGSGVDLSRADAGGWYALIFALETGDELLVDRLLKLGADVNVKDTRGRNALLSASSAGRLEWVDKFLEQGADPGTADAKGRTALMLAAAGGHEDVMRRLLASGARVDATDREGGSALIDAIKGDHAEAIELLVENGVSPDVRFGEKEMTPLIYAAGNGMAGLVAALIKAGGAIDARSSEGKTPLIAAILDGKSEEGQASIVELLLRAGADASIRDEKGLTAWDYVTAYWGKDSAKIMALLKKN